MPASPMLGVLLHWLGGLASGSFCVPCKAVRKWSWETYWLVGGFFPWIIRPVLLAGLRTEDLFGVPICLIGIAVAAFAGPQKEREMPEAEKKKTIAEFSFRKALLVATFSGVMSACLSFALTAGNPIGEAAVTAETPALWSGLPKPVIVLLGGLTTNCVWCGMSNIKHRTGRQYFAAKTWPEPAGLSGGGGEDAPADARSGNTTNTENTVPLLVCAVIY